MLGWEEEELEATRGGYIEGGLRPGGQHVFAPCASAKKQMTGWAGWSAGGLEGLSADDHSAGHLAGPKMLPSFSYCLLGGAPVNGRLVWSALGDQSLQW